VNEIGIVRLSYDGCVNARQHWETIYTSKAPNEVSWYQPKSTVSLDLILRVASSKDVKIVDAGGGASTHVDSLLQQGFTNVTVTDIASAALDHAQRRLGEDARRVAWRCADVLADTLADDSVDIWHDRAVFHFLTSAEQRQRYVEEVRRIVKLDGFVIVGTFAEDGPEKCSGLEIVRYSARTLHDEFGPAFELIESTREEHITPSGSAQQFQYCVCVNRRTSHCRAA